VQDTTKYHKANFRKKWDNPKLKSKISQALGKNINCQIKLLAMELEFDKYFVCLASKPWDR
jgi:hypothetical protein